MNSLKEMAAIGRTEGHRHGTQFGGPLTRAKGTAHSSGVCESSQQANSARELGIPSVRIETSDIKNGQDACPSTLGYGSVLDLASCSIGCSASHPWIQFLLTT